MGLVGRRQFLIATGGLLAVPHATWAQQSWRVYRIGMLLYTMPTPEQIKNSTFQQRLAELGWVEGKNILFERRAANGKIDRFQDLAADLVRLNVDVIVTFFNAPVIGAMKATQTIPIVTMGVNDPVKFGFAQSLARPGGNVTGLSFEAGPTIDTKSFELLKQTVPSAKRIAVLGVPADRPRVYLDVLPGVAKALGVELLLFEAGTPEEIEGTLARIGEARAEALFVPGYPHFQANSARIAELALKHRVPTGAPSTSFADAGCLIGHGIDLGYHWRRTAEYVDRIFKGAKAGELPYEQPRKYELVVNLKTARALGITIPPLILVRADRVIE